MEDMDDIVQEFLVESHENLDQLDRDLIELETSPDSRELLARIFRTIHTIKGTSGFLAFGQLEKVAHVGENLLSRLRDGQMQMTEHITDVLLSMVDSIRECLTAIEQSGGDASVDIAATADIIRNTYEAADRGEEIPTRKSVAAASAAASTSEAAPAADGASEATAATPEPVESEPTPAEAPVAEAGSDSAPTAESAAPQPEVTPEPAPAPAPPPAAVVEPTPPPAPTPPPPPAPTPVPAATANNADPDAKPRRSAAESVVRVDVELLDQLMLLVGELVLTRNQIVQYAGKQSDQTLVRASQRLNLIATELQEGVMKTRMQPMDHLWSKLPRVVRDLGAQCGKNVRLEMIGKETELDRTLLEAVKDPLTHLIRNAVDHGLEPPADRVADGKPEQGLLQLRAYHEGGQVVVEVRDDGKGINPEIIGRKVVEKGLKTAEQVSAMSHADILQLIFLPGFSTAAAVTNVSGRGVGMDVVRSNIEAIGGTIEVESKVGQGSICRLRIPLTLAIVPALTVECSGDVYAIPQVNLLELVALDPNDSQNMVEDVAGVPVYRLRGNLLPLVYLSQELRVTSKPVDDHVVIAVLQAEGRRFGLVVDTVISTEEIVVKPLSPSLKCLGTYSGATILGDGRVALILDIQALARRSLMAEGGEKDAIAAGSTTYHGEVVDEGTQVLVAGIGSDRRVAIPLDMVTRLEEVVISEIEHVGTREVLQYRGKIMPLLRLDQHLGSYSDAEVERLPLVVCASEGRGVAIVVSEIIDIVSDSSTVTSDVDDHGLLGSAVIKDRIVELLDVRAAIMAVDPMFFQNEHNQFGEEPMTFSEVY